MPEFQNESRGMSQLVEQNIERMINNLNNSFSSHVQVTPNMVPRLFENVNYIAAKMKDKVKIVLRHIPEVPGWTPEVLEQLREQLFLCYEKYGDKIEKILHCERSLTSNGLCGAGKHFAGITPSGDIYGCHRFYFNKNRDFILGSLDGGFIHNAKTELLEEYTRDNIIGCTECDAYELCDRCVASNFGENYDILMPTDDNCEVNRSIFYATFNYIKNYQPWMTNYEPQPSARIAMIPKDISNRSFIINYLLPMYYERQELINALVDRIYKLESKVEYYERKKNKHSH
jgi:radical SAM protein with 4Fe4S-binding SPASM domain